MIYQLQQIIYNFYIRTSFLLTPEERRDIEIESWITAWSLIIFALGCVFFLFQYIHYRIERWYTLRKNASKRIKKMVQSKTILKSLNNIEFHYPVAEQEVDQECYEKARFHLFEESLFRIYLGFTFARNHAKSLKQPYN